MHETVVATGGDFVDFFLRFLVSTSFVVRTTRILVISTTSFSNILNPKRTKYTTTNFKKNSKIYLTHILARYLQQFRRAPALAEI